jgi:NADPH-dependent 2,4-dienoyl-CoA reductase/sulfur reductase-like enzyme
MAHHFEVLVVGGGPAGIAAAITAAECGVKVGLVDDNVCAGGQIWRGEAKKSTLPEARVWLQKLRASSVTTFSQACVFHQPTPCTLLAETPDNLLALLYSKLVLATGARERFLPFPGWTLPNVMGAGGLQAMVKSGLPIAGKRVVIAGTGPLLLAVAAYLHRAGAKIPIVAEQASRGRLAAFTSALLSQPGKLAQAMRLKSRMAAIPYRTNSWPIAADGREKIESVTLSVGGTLKTFPCDYLACGFHLVPNTELADLLGCDIRQGVVRVDEFQRASVDSVFCAGEPTGIGGLELAVLEGQIAGFAAAGRPEQARTLFRKRDKLKGFVRSLNRTFQLRSELRGLSTPETIVCRCEDVRMGQLQPYTSWRIAKLQTRCGMGPCQGRICGPATEFLFKWHPDSVRPPIFPTRCEALAATLAHETRTTGGQQ